MAINNDELAHALLIAMSHAKMEAAKALEQADNDRKLHHNPHMVFAIRAEAQDLYQIAQSYKSGDWGLIFPCMLM